MENNNKFVTTAIEVVSADALDIKMRNRIENAEEKVGREIKKQNQRIKKIENTSKIQISEIETEVIEIQKNQEEISTRILLVEAQLKSEHEARIKIEEALQIEQRARADSRERRTAENAELRKENSEIKKQFILLSQDVSEFKTATAQSFNIVHEHLNIHGNLIYLALSQIDKLNERMDNLGRDTAARIPLNEIVVEMSKQEEEFLTNILKGKVPEWEAALNKVKSSCIKNIVEAGIDSGLAIYNQTKKENISHNVLNPHDKKTLMQTFVNSFVAGIVNPLNETQNPTVQGIIFALKAMVEGGKFAYAVYQNKKSKKQMKEFWEEELPKYEKDMKKYLKDGVNIYDISSQYGHAYSTNYYRDDVTITMNPDRKNPFFEPSYTREFARIPGYKQHISGDTDISRRLRFDGAGNAIGKFNPNIYLKDNLTEYEKNDFECKFRMYRAICIYSSIRGYMYVESPSTEFESNYYCEDNLILKSTEDDLSRIFVAFFSVSLPAIGIIKGVKHSRWRNNIKHLREDILRHCVFGNQSMTLDSIIIEREALVAIKNYADLTQSLGARQLYEECDKNKHLQIKPEKIELFEEAFDLYQKLTNIGVAGSKNFLNYAFQTKLSGDERLEPTQLIFDTVQYGRNAWANQSQPITLFIESSTTNTEINILPSENFMMQNSTSNLMRLQAAC